MIKSLTLPILAILLLVGIGVSVYKLDNTEVIAPIIQTDIIEEGKITSTNAWYVSEKDDSEAKVVYYSNKTAVLDLIGSPYLNISLDIATSGSGARYENSELGLVLWEKAPELNIYKDDRVIFTGRLQDVVQEENQKKLLTSGTWVWTKTFNGVGPMAEDGGVIIPKKLKAFTLTFTNDGKVSGTTDCNSFSGTYAFQNTKIKFGDLASTLMFCEGSQEAEFIKMLTNSESFVFGKYPENELILENDVTIYFNKTK